jgi:malate/lactate dehydrogenase
VTGSADLFAAAGADIAVIADPAIEGEWYGDQGGAVLRRLHGFSPDAIFVCAGSQHCALVDYGVRVVGIARTRLIGSASEALGAGARAIVALERNASPGDVALTVLGIPPRHIVILWESATLHGFALTGILSEPTRRRLSDRIAALWPVGPYALAAASAKVVELLLGRSRHTAVCFMAPDDTSGVRSRTAAVPVRLGPAGMVEAVSAPLTGSERIALENATLI